MKPTTTDVKSFSNWYEKVGPQPVEPIFPVAILSPGPGFAGGLSSALISRDVL